MSQQALPQGATSVAIRSAAWYMPEHTLPITQVRTLDETGRTTRDAPGIDTVRADDRLDSVTLAERAARRALAQAGLDARDLGALVMVESRVQETFLSSEVTRLRHQLGADNALTFSVGGLGCVSVTPALLTARGLLAADPAVDHVLVVHGSKPAAALRYRHPVTVNGDGGRALLLSRGARAPVPGRGRCGGHRTRTRLSLGPGRRTARIGAQGVRRVGTARRGPARAVRGRRPPSAHARGDHRTDRC